MSQSILEGTYESFPQPPTEVSGFPNTKASGQVGHLALENILAGTNSELKASVITFVPDQPTPLKDIRDEMKQHADPGKPFPTLSDVRHLFKNHTDTSTLPIGVFDYDFEADTAARRSGTELVVATANHLLGVSLRTGIAIADLTGVHVGEFTWSGFSGMEHLSRLLLCIKIGKSLPDGIDSAEIREALRPFILEPLRVERITKQLEKQGHIVIDRQGHRKPNHFVPKKSLVTAADMLDTSFATLNGGLDSFAAKAQRLRKAILENGNLSQLYDRGRIRSGRSYPDRIQPLHDAIVHELRQIPEGMSLPELYNLFGVGYKNQRSFNSAVTKATKLAGSQFKFVRSNGGPTRGSYQFRPNDSQNSDSQI